MFKNNEREFVISLPKQPKCKREQMLLSLPKKWNITVPILFFSDVCGYYLRGIKCHHFSRQCCLSLPPQKGFLYQNIWWYDSKLPLLYIISNVAWWSVHQTPNQGILGPSPTRSSCAKFKSTPMFRVVKSSRLPVKITAYLVSISRLLCLAFLYGWRFLNKIYMYVDWPLTLIT